MHPHLLGNVLHGHPRELSLHPSPHVNSCPSSFHWYVLCLLGVWILKRDHINILLQPAACQSQRRCRRRASSGGSVLGCVFASTRQKIHVITSEAQEAVPPDRTACVGSTLSGLHWLIPHSTRGCVCECVCRRECVWACLSLGPSADLPTFGSKTLAPPRFMGKCSSASPQFGGNLGCGGPTRSPYNVAGHSFPFP